MREFHGTIVLGTVAPEERKFLELSLPVVESSMGTTKVLSVDFPLLGTKVLGHVKFLGLKIQRCLWQHRRTK